MTWLPGASEVLTHGLGLSPLARALRATRPAAISTLGFEVLVQLVIAAMTTSPSPISWLSPSTATRVGRCLSQTLERSPLNTSSTLLRLMRSCGRLGPASEAWTVDMRSEEHTSELQSLMRITYAVFCLQ